jgi:hypothetical protein
LFSLDVVVDVGFIDNRGWAVIEFNALCGVQVLTAAIPTRSCPAIVAASGAKEGESYGS